MHGGGGGATAGTGDLGDLREQSVRCERGDSECQATRLRAEAVDRVAGDKVPPPPTTSWMRYYTGRQDIPSPHTTRWLPGALACRGRICLTRAWCRCYRRCAQPRAPPGSLAGIRVALPVPGDVRGLPAGTGRPVTRNERSWVRDLYEALSARLLEVRSIRGGGTASISATAITLTLEMCPAILSAQPSPSCASAACRMLA